MKRKFLLTAVIALVGWSICSQSAIAGSLQIIRSLELPFPAGQDLDVAWDGEHLWTMAVVFNQPGDGDVSATAYELSPLDGSLLSSFNIHLFDQQGLTWDGTHFFTTNNTSVLANWGHGTPPDALPDSIDQFSTDGTHLDSFSPPHDPDAITTGIAWDGTHLWLSDRKHREIMQVDPADGSLVTSFPSPGTDPDSLAWDGSSLWSLDLAENMIYQLDTFGSVLETWSLPGIVAEGLTFEGESLWILDNDAHKLYQLVIPEPCTLLLLATAMAALLLAKFRSRQGGLQ